MGFRGLGVWGLGVWGLGFGVWGLGLWGLGFGVWGVGFEQVNKVSVSVYGVVERSGLNFAAIIITKFLLEIPSPIDCYSLRMIGLIEGS